MKITSIKIEKKTKNYKKAMLNLPFDFILSINTNPHLMRVEHEFYKNKIKLARKDWRARNENVKVVRVNRLSRARWSALKDPRPSLPPTLCAIHRSREFVQWRDGEIITTIIVVKVGPAPVNTMRGWVKNEGLQIGQKKNKNKYVHFVTAPSKRLRDRCLAQNSSEVTNFANVFKAQPLLMSTYS